MCEEYELLFRQQREAERRRDEELAKREAAAERAAQVLLEREPAEPDREPAHA